MEVGGLGASGALVFRVLELALQGLVVGLYEVRDAFRGAAEVRKSRASQEILEGYENVLNASSFF